MLRFTLFCFLVAALSPSAAQIRGDKKAAAAKAAIEQKALATQQAVEQSQLALYKLQIQNMAKSRGISPQEAYFQRLFKIAENLTDYEGVDKLIKTNYKPESKIGILYYFFHNDTLTRVLFDPANAVTVNRIPIARDELTALPEQLRNAVVNYKPGTAKSRGVAVEVKPTEKLEHLLTKATELMLPDNVLSRFKHLVFIPAVNLGTMPFHLLKPKDQGYLIDSCSFTVAPGLIDFLAMSDRITTTRGMGVQKARFTIKNLLMVSNPQYPTSRGAQFQNLPGAAAEADTVIKFAEQYHLLAGKYAVKDSVFKHMRHADVAYFATHGVASTDEAMDKSFIVLAGETDPFLTAREIQDMRNLERGDFAPSAFPEMVVLSACQTGLGQTTDAGVTGLARAFIIAGSRHVVMSLWHVDDNATAYLMSRFMKYLGESINYQPAAPLRKAILETKLKYPAPVHWASFSLFGINY